MRTVTDHHEILTGVNMVIVEKYNSFSFGGPLNYFHYLRAVWRL